MNAEISHRLETFLALETAVWQALVSGDANADAALLSQDFLGVYPSGFAGKVDHAGQLDNGPVMRSFDLDQARILVITPDHVMLSYRARYSRLTGPGEVMYISSLWTRSGDSWVSVFSQDTPATSDTAGSVDH